MRHPGRHRLLGVFCCAALLATGCDSRPAAQSPVAADLAVFLQRLEAIHPDPFHGIDRAEFVTAIDSLATALPTLSTDQAVVEVSRVTALLSRAGRDGHEFAVPADGHQAPVLPLRVYEFAEGVVITAAQPPYEGLVGARITAIAGRPITDVLARIEPLVPRDGPATVADFRPGFLVRTDVLKGLGLAGAGPVDVTVSGDTGARTVAVDPLPFDDYLAWAGDIGAIRLPERAGTLYLSNEHDVLWSQLLPGSASLYVRYTVVQRPGAAALAAAVDPAATRLILDIRQNPGGDNHNNLSIVGLLNDFRAAHPGAPIVVLTDRVTFSAAANLATDVERLLHPVFVGEAMGGGLNFWGDVRWVDLDHLPVPMRIAVSSRYWQQSTPDDPRLTIEPAIAIPVTAADYFADRDPALAAAEAVT